MNWHHLQTFVWLRWHLLANQWRRAGALNAALMIIVCVGALVTAVPLFIGCFVLATNLIPKAAPVVLLLAWDGLLFLFLLLSSFPSYPLLFFLLLLRLLLCG